jgi:hypothetical protein
MVGVQRTYERCGPPSMTNASRSQVTLTRITQVLRREKNAVLAIKLQQSHESLELTRSPDCTHEPPEEIADAMGVGDGSIETLHGQLCGDWSRGCLAGTTLRTVITSARPRGGKHGGFYTNHCVDSSKLVIHWS